MQNDMRKGGTARTDETRSLFLFNKVGFTKQKRKEIYRLSGGINRIFELEELLDAAQSGILIILL